MKKFPRFRLRIGPLLLLLTLLLPGVARSQQRMEASGFKVPEYYSGPRWNQIKSLLEGARGVSQPDGGVQVFEARLQTFSEKGEPELVVEAPECFQAPGSHSVNSSGPIHAQSANGKFSIEGEGFLCQQTNSVIWISNRVHTTAQPEMFAVAGTKKPAPSARAPSQRIEIFSERFNYAGTSGVATYSENVHVTGTNLDLKAASLTLKLPMKEQQLQSITAETNVIVEYNEVHATGQRAVYTTDNGLVTVTGHPRWTAGEREGRGDELVIDRTNKTFIATGDANLLLPVSGGAGSGFLPELGLNKKESSPGAPAVLEVQSDYYEVHTNWAFFRGNVRVLEKAGSELKGTMLCDRMTTTFQGTNELRELVAEGGVSIQQTDREMSGGKAVFTKTSNQLELSQNPTWRAGVHTGKGHRILVNTERNEMVVQGNASMRLPAAELSQGPGLGNMQGSTPKPKGSTNEFAEIFSADYTIRETNAVNHTGIAVFRGGVYITQTNLNWACETMTVGLPKPGERIDHILAEQAVVFDMVDTNGMKVHGTGDRAVYTYKVAGAITNDQMQLFGVPATVKTTNQTVQNSVLTLDVARHTLILPAGSDYVVRGTAPALDTNKFLLPNSKFLK